MQIELTYILHTECGVLTRQMHVYDGHGWTGFPAQKLPGTFRSSKAAEKFCDQDAQKVHTQHERNLTGPLNFAWELRTHKGSNSWCNS